MKKKFRLDLFSKEHDPTSLNLADEIKNGQLKQLTSDMLEASKGGWWLQQFTMFSNKKGTPV